jgi:hypothetical protein
VSGQPGERTNVIPIVEVVRIGKREGIDRQPIRGRLIHQDEPGRLGKWERLQEDRVGKTQHGAVDAKAERKRRDRRDGKARRLLHPADHVAQVLTHCSHW